MMYLMIEETMKNFKSYVSNRGNLVGSYLSRLVNENDLTYLDECHKRLKIYKDDFYPFL